MTYYVVLLGLQRTNAPLPTQRDLLDINQFDVYLKQLETRMDARAARIGTND